MKRRQGRDLQSPARPEAPVNHVQDRGYDQPQGGGNASALFIPAIGDWNVIDESILSRAEELLGHEFAERDLLRRALIHASLADSRLESNERLEFLGDAVLGMVVCEYLHDRYEDLLEGELTKIKSNVVSRRTCARLADRLGLSEMLQLGKGLSNHHALPKSVSAAVYESLIGALYVDAGLDITRSFILQGMKQMIEEAARSGHQFNFKSVLQQTAQQHYDATPQYLLLDEKGPDHAKCFEVCVAIGPRRFASTWGPSKKEAEQHAALEALLELGYAVRTQKGEIRVRHTLQTSSSDAPALARAGEDAA